MSDLPDESPSQALARIEKQHAIDRNPRAEIQIDPHTKIKLSDEQFEALMREDLVIAFYNLSNRLPEPYDFDGLADKTDEECMSMYGRTRSSYLRGHLLMDDNTKPLEVSKQLATAPMQRRENRAGIKTINAHLQFQKTGWITHFAIGSRTHGILMGGEFGKPIPTKPGNGFTFGVRLEQVRNAINGSTTRNLPGQSQDQGQRRQIKEVQGLPAQGSKQREPGADLHRRVDADQ